MQFFKYAALAALFLLPAPQAAEERHYRLDGCR